MDLVKIKNGSYRNVEVKDEVFPLVKHYQHGAKGGFITVDGSAKFGIGANKIRVKVASPLEVDYIGQADAEEEGFVAEVLSEKTDEERMAEIAERFSMLDMMTLAAIKGNIRAMIVSGPPGVGKSYGVVKQLESQPLFQMLGDNRQYRYEVIKGSTTAIGLYQQLYKHSDPGSVLVFDDCDSILFDDISLNLLKGALDSGKSRRISWLAESRVLADAGVPSQFNFRGTVIFITNLKFDSNRGKLKDHLEALQSRCHYLDLTLDTVRDKLLRIKQIARTGMLFSDFDFDEAVQDEIVTFMDVNQNKLREVSLRMAIKIGELRGSFPEMWREMATVTCMRGAV